VTDFAASVPDGWLRSYAELGDRTLADTGRTDADRCPGTSNCNRNGDVASFDSQRRTTKVYIDSHPYHMVQMARCHVR
jgi:hypothetical protein